MWASNEGHLECVKVLLDNGAEVNMRKKVSAVFSRPILIHVVRPPCVKTVCPCVKIAL